MSSALPSPTKPPFLPSDIDASKLLPRAVWCHAVAAARGGEYADGIARKFFPSDRATLALIQRAATSPAMVGTTGWAADLAGQAWAAFLASLSDTAAGALLNAAPRFDLSGIGRMNLPRATATGTPQWIAEGGPSPVGQGSTSAPVLGPPKKLAIIEVLDREVAESAGPEGGEQAVSMILRDAVTHQLDTSLFSNVAASSVQPAGIVAGITATTATTGGGLNAALGDLRNLTDAIVQAGGSGSPMFFASPGRALTLQGYFGAPLAGRVFGSAFIPSGTMFAIDPRAFASGFDDVPQIAASMSALLHFEDTSPQQIGTPGSPNVVAAPLREVFQTDAIAIKCILKAAWVLRVPGAAAWINTGLSW